MLRTSFCWPTAILPEPVTTVVGTATLLDTGVSLVTIKPLAVLIDAALTGATADTPTAAVAANTANANFLECLFSLILHPHYIKILNNIQYNFSVSLFASLFSLT